MRKRLVSWLLVVVMCLNYLPITAMATGETGDSIPDGVEFMPNQDIVLCEGQSQSVNATLYEGGQRVDSIDVSWEVGDPSMLMVTPQESGGHIQCKITAIKPGDTTITVHASSETQFYEKSLNVHINEAIFVTTDGKSAYLEVDPTDTVEPPSEPILSVTPDPDVPGKYLLEGLSPGRSVLTIKSESGGYSYVDVYVDMVYVIWHAGDEIVSQDIAIGETPKYDGDTPTKAADSEFQYTFSGWDKEPGPVTEKTIYTAQFDAERIYTIELPHKDITMTTAEGNNTFQMEPTIVPEPTDHGDTVKWTSKNPDIASIDDTGLITAHAAGHTMIECSVGNFTNMASVTVNNAEGFFTITFEMPGKDPVRKVYQVGETPVPPEDTARPEDDTASYRFTGWEPEIQAVSGDMTYIAQYETIYKEYKVEFQNWDGTVLQTEQLHMGDAVAYKKPNPTRPATETTIYQFTGWSPEVQPTVSGNATYVAQYRETPREEFQYALVMSEEERSGYAGEEFTLTVETVPAEMPLSNETLWRSENESIAKIIGNNVGVDTVTVKLIGADENGSNTTNIVVSDGSQTAICTVTVNATMHTITWKVDTGGAQVDVETTQCAEGMIPVYPYEDPQRQPEGAYYYTFIGWEPELAPCTGPATYTAKFQKHTNVAVSLDKQTMSLAPGQTAALSVTITPEDPDVVVQWKSSNKTVATVDEEGNVRALSPGTTDITATVGGSTAKCVVTVAATFYKITWKVDGQDDYVTNCKEGEIPVYDKPTPAKPSTEEFDYIFEGWTPALSAAQGDRTYKAVFSEKKRSYTITWDFANGSPVKTERLEYGATIVPPADPEKEETKTHTYEFLGWDPSGPLQQPVKGNVRFTARYLATEKKGLFINPPPKGTKMVIGEFQTLTANVTPAGTSMAWAWKSSKPEVATIDDSGYLQAKGEGTTTITAASNDGRYSDSIDIVVSAERFTITWEVDGKQTTEDYVKGETPKFKGSTDKEMDNEYIYTFKGWDHPIVPVTGPTTYVAQYDRAKREYTITWAIDGREVKETYNFGVMPSFKESTDKEGDENVSYLFLGWQPALAAVSGDQTYTAKYQEVRKTYSITWVVDGVSTQTFWEWGQTPKYEGTPTKESTNEYSYRFTGWNTPVVPVNGTATYIAQFEQKPREYTINWEIEGKRTTQTYHYGDMPKFEGSTELAQTPEFTYTFKGWLPEVTKVTQDVIYVAQYDKVTRKYPIIFRDSDGKILQESEVEYGKTPKYEGKTPTKAPTTNGNGTVTKHTFKGWTPDIKPVTGAQTYTPLFTSNDGSADSTVVASFRNWDGEILDTVEVKLGGKPEYTGDTPTRPIKNGYRYIFTGWSPEITAITEDTVFTAQFRKADASEMQLTTDDISKMTKEDWTVLDFPCGKLYISKEGAEGLAEFKDTINITIEQDKKDIITMTFTKGKNEKKAKTITDDLEGLTFLATDLPNGDVVSIADDTSKRYEIEPFSVTDRAGTWAAVPGTCRMKMEDTSYRNFIDVSSRDWFSDYINYVTARGMMVGTSINTFSPQANATRAQAIVVLYRLAGSPSFVGGKAYEDVSPQAWYTTAVFWATANELLPGLSDTKFGVNQAITREDLAVLLYNYAAYLGFDTSESTGLGKYLDVGQVTPSKVEAMKWAVATDILEGSNRSLDPVGATNRAEMAAMMMRFIGHVTVPDVDVEEDDD